MTDVREKHKINGTIAGLKQHQEKSGHIKMGTKCTVRCVPCVQLDVYHVYT